MIKPIKKVWIFPSSSNPKKRYQTLEYKDGTLSCDCPGWTRRVDTDGNRSCRHVRSVMTEVVNTNTLPLLSVDVDPQNEVTMGRRKLIL